MNNVKIAKEILAIAKSLVAGPTVKTLLEMFFDKLSKFDTRLQIKQPSDYRWSHYKEAYEEMAKSLKIVEKDSTPEAYAKLYKAIQNSWDDDFPPAKAMLKELKKYTS